jgi:hypothetical protein
VALIAYLSLIPRSMEVRTSLLLGLEHVLAYSGTAGFMVLAYPGRPTWLIIGALCAYSGLMEFLQIFSGCDDGDGHQDRHGGGDEHAGT